MPRSVINLHLGCGDRYIPGFLHLDIRSFKKIDVIGTSDLLPLRENSIDLIYASHVLEHFSRHDTDRVLQEWYRVLKRDGILRIAVPDFAQIVKIYRETEDLPMLTGLLYGGQNYPENFHHVAFDFEYLSQLLHQTGFRNVDRYDWRRTIHKDYDDFSQSYLPHMDKENGTLMSLNVNARK